MSLRFLVDSPRLNLRRAPTVAGLHLQWDGAVNASIRWLPARLPLLHISRPLPSKDSLLCLSEEHSCATSICQTTLWRDRGRGPDKERGVLLNGARHVCFRSAGTSLVSHFPSTVIDNKLLWFLVQCEWHWQQSCLRLQFYLGLSTILSSLLYVVFIQFVCLIQF